MSDPPAWAIDRRIGVLRTWEHAVNEYHADRDMDRRPDKHQFPKFPKFPKFRKFTKFPEFPEFPKFRKIQNFLRFLRSLKS